MMPKLTIAVLASLALAVLPAAASAHSIAGHSATCTEASTTFSGFEDNNKPASWLLVVDHDTDNAVVLTGSFTFPGAEGTLVVPYPEALAGPGAHTIRVETSWPGLTNPSYVSWEERVSDCPAPPEIIVPPEDTPPVIPPKPTAPAPTPTTTPVPAAPATTPSPDTPPTTAPLTKAPSAPVFDQGHRRFGKLRTKRCVHGRRVLHDSKGRRFTVCRSKPTAAVYRRPSFTG